MKLVTTLFLALTLSAGAFAATEAPVTIEIVLEHYEAVREALVNDTLEGTLPHLQAITNGLAKLRDTFDADAAGVETASQDQAVELLGKMHLAATTLTQASESTDLATSREAFYELTKPLVQYRELMTGNKPLVAYCPMAKKSWLQDDDKIGNPYAGQAMATCGSVVSGGR